MTKVNRRSVLGSLAARRLPTGRLLPGEASRCRTGAWVAGVGLRPRRRHEHECALVSRLHAGLGDQALSIGHRGSWTAVEGSSPSNAGLTAIAATATATIPVPHAEYQGAPMGKPIKRAARHTRVKLEASAAAWRSKTLSLQRRVTNLRKLVNSSMASLSIGLETARRPDARRASRDRPRYALLRRVRGLHAPAFAGSTRDCPVRPIALNTTVRSSRARPGSELDGVSVAAAAAQ